MGMNPYVLVMNPYVLVVNPYVLVGHTIYKYPLFRGYRLFQWGCACIT
jgi:hypothetical protein